MTKNTLHTAENAMILTRLICQYMIENLSAQIPILLGKWSKELSKYTANLDGSTISECMMNINLEILIEMKLNNENYHLYKESLNLLIIQLSSDIYFENIDLESNHFLNLLSQRKLNFSPSQIVNVLVRNFLEQRAYSKSSHEEEKRNVTSFFSSFLTLSCTKKKKKI